MNGTAQARPEEYGIMFEAEERLWWYLGMERITRAILDGRSAGAPALDILDAGCGTGGALRVLRQYGRVTGLDLSPIALQYCARRDRGRWIRGSVARLPFGGGAFDLVTSFDVLFMLPRGDDRIAAREFARVLRPGGRVVVRVAAYDWLRGEHDAAWASQHRYTAREVAELFRQAGLIVEHVTYANMWLFPAAAAKRLAERVLPAQRASDTAIGMGRLNGALARVLGSEAWLIARGARLPFGLSVIGTARKPG